ncbi:NADH-quinone oxidoreductase subunit A [Solidesulfovibrio sp.]|jgi:NADH-quinone oxidoreductase subunit A|uniref:NADH-quinone oxidoreductase subunit A n=1 Tax=Solidesulfovibrio sp. TaxID=2910990 RepID=UPI000EB83EC1|nr:NADH-quinone oxidoreductase subunit A [Solidesulfovibrio sp.]MEA5089161.1 NADH-quinone oxidoreductase subunit A [Solidesulfovibrio sp.]HCR12148.1 NADH-quinone oxidoreductase subunit A [Desulfovibrio sp.]HML60461.1 NADH-quinone oxidoreductase subunit A [Solidesulfovibrio sp.]
MVFTWLQAAILLFFLGGVLFGAGPLLGSLFLAPKARGGAMGATYECGVPTHGRTWVKFGINYYFYALIFLAFEVDILYLFPVAALYAKPQGLEAAVKLLVFIAVLAAAIIYFMRKGVFTWPRRIQVAPRP